ncbi:hypothetical protein EVAR_46469_1 [Eumeta japonica]|uniref:Uncharacterized protein n=1 Tax=Eumeta variegata TaxID=151549 RepID=A0A4C1XHR0_EUMVA|nr:hypothetical protein EVAR_46469_1 [Eumeta japonica]
MDVKHRIGCFHFIFHLIITALLLSDKCTIAKSFSDSSLEIKLFGNTQHSDVSEDIHPLEVSTRDEEISTKIEDNSFENDDTPLEEELSSVQHSVSFVQYQTTQRAIIVKTKTKRSANYSPIYPQLPSTPTWPQGNYNPSAPNYYPYQNPQSSSSYYPGNYNSSNHYSRPNSGQFYPNTYNQNNTQKPGYNHSSSFYPHYNPNMPYQPNGGTNRYNASNPGNFNYVNCSTLSPYSTPNPALCPTNNNFYPQRPGQSTYRPNINPSYPPPHNWHGQQGATTYPGYNNTYSQRPPQYNNTNGSPYGKPNSYFNPSAVNTNYPPYNRPNGTNAFNPFGTQNQYSTPSYGQNPYQRPYNSTANNYGQNLPAYPYNANGYNQNGSQTYNAGQTPLAPFPPNNNFSNSKPFNPVDMTYPQNSNNPYQRY